MNLQINSPYKPCPYQCPYCCARYESDTLFQDSETTSLYFTDKPEYMQRLRDVLSSMEFDTIVITGSTEPTLFPDWMNDVLDELELGCYRNIEVATRNTDYAGRPPIQVISYSFHKVPKHICWSWAQITRAVFILHDGISIDDIIRYHQIACGQTTVKNLATNSYGNPAVNDWVAQHRVTLSDGDIKRLTDAGIRYDHDCNNSANRYVIFRADGKLYDSWQAKEPMDEMKGGED